MCHTMEMKNNEKPQTMRLDNVLTELYWNKLNYLSFFHSVICNTLQV